MKKIKLNKRIILLIGLNILLIILGLLYPSIIDKSILTSKVTTYISNLIKSNYKINDLIRVNIINNSLENIIIYIFTIPLITFPISLLIYIIKSFSLGVQISSLIYIYKFKGIIYNLILLIPSILNLIVLSISIYYSISYFIILIKYKKKINKKHLLKGYIKVLLITLFIQILISIIDSYLSYYLFKFLK